MTLERLIIGECINSDILNLGGKIMSFSFINFIIYALVYIIFMPVLSFIHELGHAIPALIFTKGEVSVNVGNL